MRSEQKWAKVNNEKEITTTPLQTLSRDLLNILKKNDHALASLIDKRDYEMGAGSEIKIDTQKKDITVLEKETTKKLDDLSCLTKSIIL